MNTIITRFPPSPSGFLHVGGARTALFNWLYARHMKGKFVLRIEDTDVARSTQESVDAILDGLEWLGIDWDEGPYFQSQRMDVYREHINQLLSNDRAYHCECSPEKLESMRQEAMAQGGKPKYDGSCREKGLSAGSDTVVRFKAPMVGTTVLKDVVKGNIVFQNEELDDFVIQRSAGTPTYNFAVVVDDITMGINTIIRGDDHVMNTPKQMQLYKAFEKPIPVFAHVPMVLAQDRSRLKKRTGAASVTGYRDMGYLPDALVNYLVRLGWSFGDQEFFTREELIQKFTLDNIGKSAGKFDEEKLLALNADHIQASSPENLAHLLPPFMAAAGCPTQADAYLQSAVKTLMPRSKTLADMASQALFYYGDDVTYEEKAAKKFLKPAALEPMQVLVTELEKLEDFSHSELEQAFKAVMETTGLKLGKIAQPARVALTGKTASPGIFELIEIIGKERTIARLKAAVEHIAARAEIA